ncbi:MAG: beta-N-acetylglucosaminidase domain-containing protein [Caulobacteraceae bacterium]
MAPPLGVIEGYYGRPWSWDMREGQARFLAGHGYASYIYAPKADAYLRRRWREDHPAEEADALARMAAACAQVGVGFGGGPEPLRGLSRTSARRRRRRWPASWPSSTRPASPNWRSCSTT